jgi:hypothetical protein
MIMTMIRRRRRRLGSQWGLGSTLDGLIVEPDGSVAAGIWWRRC